MKEKPRIALTMGDPAGVGPELCLRALASPAVQECCQLSVIGDESVLDAAAERTKLSRPPRSVRCWEDAPAEGAFVFDVGAFHGADVTPGKLDPACGRAAFAYVEASIQAALSGRVAAVTTCPLNKEALHLAGINFPGHTEIYAERTGVSKFCMLQYSEAVTCSFVTVHVGYREAPALITEERILDVVELTSNALRLIRDREPSLLVCGLNPHAGEHGLYGNDEEGRIIAPAMEKARERGFQVHGPVAADTAFLPANRRNYDAVICMYHDQGHIPLKAIAFDSAVNTTLGLPVVRTSVDHGTAFDIAWQGIADPGSLFAALKLAARLAPQS